jgi:enoyl-CoA hydratase
MEEARTLATKLLAQPREALRETKKIMNRYLHVAATQHLDVTLGRQLAATLSEEHHRLARTFLDKQRRPQGGG